MKAIVSGPIEGVNVSGSPAFKATVRTNIFEARRF